jgi:hypothetical protein
VVLLFLRGISLFRFVSPAIIWLLAAAGGCYAAYRCYRGQPFVYPILGELAIKF